MKSEVNKISQQNQIFMVEIIPKKIEGEMPLKNVFLFTAGALLLAVIFGYVVLLRLESGTLLALQDLDDGISSISTKENKKNEENVLNAGRKINEFKVLWAGRSKSSQFFGNFGTLIHPQIWFSSIDFNLAEIKAAVSGKAANFVVLEQQLIFLNSQSDIVDSFDLSGVSLGEGGEVNFNLTINFTPKIFAMPAGRQEE